MRHVTLTALLALAAWATPLAGPAAAADVVGRATLQVRSEPGYDAGSISRILTDDAYLGSVMPGIVPFHTFAAEEIPDGVTVLTSVPAGNEILTLSLRGTDDATVRAHLSALLENLASIVPSRRADSLHAVKTGEQSLNLAEMEYEKIRGRLSAFVAKNGAIDPTQWLNTLRASLQKRASELERLDLDVASARALRDYLVETIAKTPMTVATIDSPDIEAARAELARIKVTLAQLEETKTPTHPDRTRAKNDIADVTKKLELLRKSAAETSDTPNPRYTQLERELFEVERELALNESRRRELKGYVDDVRDEAKRLSLVESEWRNLREQMQMAEQRLFGARQMLDNAQAQARQALASEWATVIAGPTYASE